MLSKPESSNQEKSDLKLLGELLDQYLTPQQVAQIRPVFARVLEADVRRRKILELVQEALGTLRVDMKYIVFDLEATRRERDELRQKYDV